MSFDLAVLAMDGTADAEAAEVMFERCGSTRNHAEGELDGTHRRLLPRVPVPTQETLPSCPRWELPV